jgi:hypothetical protein
LNQVRDERGVEPKRVESKGKRPEVLRRKK